MRERVHKFKETEAYKYAEKYKHVIRDYKCQPGDLVLVRNTAIEDSLNSRNQYRWNGPMIVVRRTRGGSYIICEMNGAVLQLKVGKFRVVPFHQRYKISIGKKIEKLIDASKERLDQMEAEAEEDYEKKEYKGKDFQFNRIRLNPKGDTAEYDSDQGSDEDETESIQEEEDDELMPQGELEESGPRRSKRITTGVWERQTIGLEDKLNKLLSFSKDRFIERMVTG